MNSASVAGGAPPTPTGHSRCPPQSPVAHVVDPLDVVHSVRGQKRPPHAGGSASAIDCPAPRSQLLALGTSYVQSWFAVLQTLPEGHPALHGVAGAIGFPSPPTHTS